MNILVTGGAGYIGSHTCVELLEKGYGVVVVDNLCNANPKSLDRVEELPGKKVKFYEGDVRDEALLRRIFAENEIGAVIHFAGLKAVGESVAQPWRYYDNNLNSTLVLTKVMGEAGCKKIIFSSSATVCYGDKEMNLRVPSKPGNPRWPRCPGLHPRSRPGQGPCGCHSVRRQEFGMRGLQLGHWYWLQRAGYGEGI